MSRRPAFRIAPIALVAVLAGCPQPEASAPFDATFEVDALVLEGRAEESSSWGADVKIEGAPEGEYLLFALAERPTSLAGLTGLDLSSCTPSTCSDVAGLGELASRVKLDAPGTVRLSAYNVRSGSDETRFFFVAIRRGAPTNDRLKVTGRVSMNAGGPCSGNPEPPSIVTSSLDGAPPIVEPAAGDAGTDASTAPSCDVLQAQVDACTTLSQNSKDTFPTFCSSISAGCRACLDGVLCGVTEQCDSLCGK